MDYIPLKLSPLHQSFAFLQPFITQNKRNFYFISLYQQHMEEILEPQASLFAAQSSHLIDRNMGQSWLQIHCKMQRTIGLPSGIRSKTSSMSQHQNSTERLQNRLTTKSFHALNKEKGEKTRIANNDQKGQLKIILNTYKQSSICTTPKSLRVKPRLLSQETGVLQHNKENGKINQNLENLQNSNLTSSKYKSISPSTVISIINKVKKNQEQRIFRCKYDDGSNKISNIQLPFIFTGKQQTRKKFLQLRQQRFLHQEQELRSSLPQKQSSSGGYLSNQEYIPPNVFSVTKLNGWALHQSQNITILDKKTQSNKGSKVFSEVGSGLSSNYHVKTIHSLQSFRKKSGKLNVLKLRHRSLQKLRVSNNKIKIDLIKQKKKDRERLLKELQELKKVKNRLCLNTHVCST